MLPNFTEDPKNKISQNPSGGSRSVAPGRTDMTKLIVAFRCCCLHERVTRHFDHIVYLGLCVSVIVCKPCLCDSQ
jgi:hypothetical protein